MNVEHMLPANMVDVWREGKYKGQPASSADVLIEWSYQFILES